MFTWAGHLCFCWVLWCTHFAWNSYMAVYSSLWTLCTRTNLRVIYSGQIRGWLDKSAGDLEHPYSDQWEPSNRLDQSQGSKCARRGEEREERRERRGERENWHEESPLLRRAALKIIKQLAIEKNKPLRSNQRPINQLTLAFTRAEH